jgi:hypothetical protein
MTYDPIDSDNDGVVEADVDNQSVDTEEAFIDNHRVEVVNDTVLSGLREGMVGYWPLNNLSDGLNDQINDNDISIVGSPSVANNGGAFGDGIRFGDGNYGVIEHSGALSVEDGDFTILAFMRVPDIDDSVSMAVQKRGATEPDSSASYSLGADGGWQGTNGSLVAAFGDGGFKAPQSEYHIGEGPLYCVGLTYDSSDNRFSFVVNGRSWGTEAFSSAPTQGNQDVRLGVKLNQSGNIQYAGDVILGPLAIYDRKLPLSELKTWSRLPYPNSKRYECEPVGELFSRNVSGGHARYDGSKTDPYRLIGRDNSQTGQPVHVWANDEWVADSGQWTQVASDVLPSGVAGEPSDVLYDGSTYYMYVNTGGGTRVVSSSSDWTSWTDENGILTDIDVGVWYDPDDGTTYLVGEDGDYAVGFGSNKLSLWTASDPTGPFSEQRTLFDMTDLPWHSGDVTIKRIDGQFWIFIDNTNIHPEYGTALLRSHNLYDTELVAEDIKRGRGGDLHVFESPDGLLGVTELSGPDSVGTRLWSLYEEGPP